MEAIEGRVQAPGAMAFSYRVDDLANSSMNGEVFLD
jgi:hypothetical protein